MKNQLSLSHDAFLDLDPNPSAPANLIWVSFPSAPKSPAKRTSWDLASMQENSGWESLAYAAMGLSAFGGVALGFARAFAS